MCDIFERTPLHYAGNAVAVDRVMSLLSSPTTNINAQDYQGFTVLHHVLANCDYTVNVDDLLEIIQMLLDANADPNLQDDRGLTPLHLAITQEYYDIRLTKCLLSSFSGINFSIKTFLNENILHYLFEKSNIYEEAVLRFFKELFEEKYIPKTILKMLLNERDSNGLTPFCVYLSNAFLEHDILKSMLDVGIDVNTHDNLGVTPLMTACWLDLDIAKVLLQHEAKPNSQDVFGRSIFYMARNVETASLILKHGGDLNTVDKFGKSVLCQSLLVSDEECVEYLIQNGGQVNTQDKYGSSPLHYAAYTDRADLVRLLLRHNADTHLYDQDNHTPFNVASIHHCKRALEAFNKHDRTLTANPVTSAHPYFSDAKEIIYPDDMRNLQEKLNLTKNTHQNCERALSEQSIVLSPYSDENQKIHTCVMKLMDSIVQRMGEIDSLFQGSLLLAGSMSEGTKVGKPDEFDFIFCLDRFAEVCAIVETRDSPLNGQAKVQSKTIPPPKEFSFFCDDSGFLLTQNVRLTFSKLLSVVIREEGTWKEFNNISFDGMNCGSEDVERPALSFTINWISCHHKYLQISIDVVPAIYQRRWLPKHTDDVSLSLMTSAVKEAGYLLLASAQDETDDQDSYFNFRVSCFPAENYLMKSLPREVLNSYILAKILLRDDFCPKLKFRGDDITTKDYVVTPSSVLKSYMMKNCLLHVLAEDSELMEGYKQCDLLGSKSDMSIQFTVSLPVKLIQKLQKLAGNEGVLPVYFLPNQNILNYEETYINVEDPEQVKDNTCKLSEEINACCSLLLGCLGIFTDE